MSSHEEHEGHKGMEENAISKLVLDAAFLVHTKLGPGLFESVYEFEALIQLAVDDSPDAVFQMGFAEIDEQTELQSAQTELGQKLLGMDRRQCDDGFDFDDHLFANHQIETKSLFELDAVINNRHWFLTLQRERLFSHFMRKHDSKRSLVTFVAVVRAFC